MNMVDTKKCFRGALYWREDVLKCAHVLKKPFSQYVRDLVHSDMERYELPDETKTILAKQIEAAVEARKTNRKIRKGEKRNKTLTVDVMSIPAKVRKSATFVKG